MSDLKTRILSAATHIAERVGVKAVTRNAVADRAACTMGSVSYHYGDVKHLHRAIIDAAIRNENTRVLGWAVAERHPSVRGLDPALQARALQVHLS